MQDRIGGAAVRRGVLILVVLGLLAIPANASAYQFHFVSPIAKTQARQTAIQRVLSIQLNLQVARHWRIDPVSFADTGIPIIIEPSAMIQADCEAVDAGCHTTVPPYTIYIAADRWRNEVVIASHEIIETETDEHAATYLNGLPAEICDPVNDTPYQVLGMAVADFVYPRWFFPQSHGWVDQEGVLTRPRTGYQGGKIEL